MKFRETCGRSENCVTATFEEETVPAACLRCTMRVTLLQKPQKVSRRRRTRRQEDVSIILEILTLQGRFLLYLLYFYELCLQGNFPLFYDPGWQNFQTARNFNRENLAKNGSSSALIEIYVSWLSALWTNCENNSRK